MGGIGGGEDVEVEDCWDKGGEGGGEVGVGFWGKGKAGG